MCALKIFNGFSLDMSSGLSHLSVRDIDSLRLHGVVKPEKTSRGFIYSFRDLLMLRVVRQLKLNDVKLKNIRQADKYLRDIDPSRDLSNYKLYIRDDTKDVLYLGDDLEKSNLSIINASRQGQLHLQRFLTILPVGKQLEQVRQDIFRMDDELDRSMRARKIISLDAVLKKHGLG